MTPMQYHDFLRNLNTRFTQEEAMDILKALEFQYQMGWEVSKAYHLTGC